MKQDSHRDFHRDETGLLSRRGNRMFVMMGREAFAEVLLNLIDVGRKGLAQEALAEIIRHMDWDGSCKLSRIELAKLLNVPDSNLSAALTELAEFGAIIRRPAGGRKISIEVNPIFATMLREPDRGRAQEEAPPIRPAPLRRRLSRQLAAA